MLFTVLIVTSYGAIDLHITFHILKANSLIQFQGSHSGSSCIHEHHT